MMLAEALIHSHDYIASHSKREVFRNRSRALRFAKAKKIKEAAQSLGTSVPARMGAFADLYGKMKLIEEKQAELVENTE